MSGNIPLGGQKAFVEYASFKLKKQDQEKRLAEEELERIRDWQRGLEQGLSTCLILLETC